MAVWVIATSIPLSALAQTDPSSDPDERPEVTPETNAPTPPEGSSQAQPPVRPIAPRNHVPRLPGSEPPLPDRSDEEAPLPEALRPEIETRLEPSNRISVGDALTLHLTVTAADGDRISIPEQSFDPFELLGTEAEHQPDRNRVRHTFRARLLALEAGTQTLGMRLRVLTRDHTLGSVQVDPIAVVVTSLLANEPDAEPKPPSEPVSVMEPDYTLAYVGSGILILALVALAAFFFARWWSRREKPAPPPPPPIPPWDVALDRLRELREHLEDDGVDLVTWADGLSDCLRQYLGDRFDFEGLESTTDEIVDRLRRRRYIGLSSSEVAAVLGDLDLVKFAKATPKREQCEAQLDAGRRIVEGTRIQKSFAVPPPSASEPTPSREASP